MKRRLAALAVLVTAALLPASLTGCGAASGGGLTVWLMDGSAPESWVTALNEAFERRHGVEVTVEIQQWDGIQNRLTTALSENDTVDVLEIGNTQTAGFAAAGGLAGLDGDEWFARQPWNDVMLSSARLGGTQYAAPWYGASRVVVYDKSVWQEAGAQVPRTRSEWLRALEQVRDNTDAEPLYLPGQSYYVLGGFLADEGGQFAAQAPGGGGENGTPAWRGALATPEGEAAMDFYRELQSFSRAPADADEASPQQSTEVIPNREIASWIGLGWEVRAAAEALRERGREADFGFFPIPGPTADKPGHVFLGGSNLAVSARAGEPELAREWIRMATSREWARRFADESGGGVVPGRDDALTEPEPGSFDAAMARAAESGYLPPLTMGWANVETEPNPVKELMTRALGGENYANAAAEADAEITTRINRE
ncbi:extracellular solute-binding protein [Streptomyces sp. 7-21]|uniref:extracellular solute-binding protein n=1 Tax=Streptomyces sp. 7-21 TaxID=2802283 RepID=UPI00191D5A06|nr:extracellular solute-binding protein [Streptomyces sp. 7-21]MBL1065084.1 extracellular solute-binding protein [Streptomyces sp. 7-21]